jgi:2'-5' RNA ligase
MVWYKEAKKEVHTGVMVALMISQDIAKKLILTKEDIPDKDAKLEPAEELHITLSYLGKIGEDIKESSKDQLFKCVEEFAKSHKLIKGSIGEVGMFCGSEENGDSALYASFDSGDGDLPNFRQQLVEVIDKIDGIEVFKNHGFTPHITLAYLKSKTMPEIVIPSIKVKFDKISIAWGGEVEHFKLG